MLFKYKLLRYIFYFKKQAIIYLTFFYLPLLRQAFGKQNRIQKRPGIGDFLGVGFFGRIEHLQDTGRTYRSYSGVYSWKLGFGQGLVSEIMQRVL